MKQLIQGFVQNSDAQLDINERRKLTKKTLAIFLNDFRYGGCTHNDRKSRNANIPERSMVWH